MPSARVWLAIFSGLAHAMGAVIRRKEKAPPVIHKNGSLGLPGDFLIAPDGRVLASKYGTHAYSQWGASGSGQVRDPARPASARYL